MYYFRNFILIDYDRSLCLLCIVKTVFNLYLPTNLEISNLLLFNYLAKLNNKRKYLFIKFKMYK